MPASNLIARQPWPDGFPDVVVHTDVRTRDRHPCYPAAKGGDADAALQLAIETLTVLRERHGTDLEILWRSQFGYGLDCLTEIEALVLCRQPSVAAIEDFLAQAAIEARGRGLEPAA